MTVSPERAGAAQLIVVGAVIYDAACDAVLCAQRSAKMSNPLLWEFPGGKVEPGETPTAALVRELHEELGIVATLGAAITTTVFTVGQRTAALHTWWATITAGMPQPHEHAQVAWIPRSTLHTLAFSPADIPTVQLVQNAPPEQHQ
ncbi:(deoxy)nucleoside triphosphate pyrophosphohydrolase [Corynebacterium choanae]|uniref:8-oxo-dGTP diphosphatase n=1 Tax=Corynebacterium choanae TaxID=1862358 RepID=A0A3G6JET1_9CORY|nr:(deoxy)nucleoside triphosphate pyrophosphohydrolase [Corynebacterium choanae]AZA14644.1 CTP pyrophosphohydrolase [Corynebacterium choanae]